MPVTLDVCIFFNDTATTEIYTLSLHDALPILAAGIAEQMEKVRVGDPRDPATDIGPLVSLAHRERVHGFVERAVDAGGSDRKSTRLNSSHANISYAVFCLNKKTTNT